MTDPVQEYILSQILSSWTNPFFLAFFLHWDLARKTGFERGDNVFLQWGMFPTFMYDKHENVLNKNHASRVSEKVLKQDG